MIRVAGFSGERPKIAKRLLEANEATSAVNCKLYSGELRAFREPLQVAEPSHEFELQSIFWAYDQYWLGWAGAVDVVKSQIIDDPYERIYYTGDGVPKMTTPDLVASGAGSAYPTGSVPLGIPRPTGTLTAAVQTASGTGDSRDVFWIYTYVSEYGEEGPPSLVSNLLTCKSGDVIRLTGWAAPPVTHTQITKARVYRLLPGFSTAQYLFVMDITLPFSTYHDDSAQDANLGEPLATLTHLPPPEDLAGLIALPNGCMAGFSGKTVCICEPFLPNAWPDANKYSVDDDIVGLGVYEDTIVALTRGHPYLIAGADPAQMRVVKLPAKQPCVSRRGVTSFEFGVVYPSPDGLMLVSGGQSKSLTNDILSRDNWWEMEPDTLHATAHDSRYVAFYKTSFSNGRSYGAGFILDFQEQLSRLTKLDFYATTQHAATESDTLFQALRSDLGVNAIQAWEGGSVRRNYTWKSKTFPAAPTNLAAVRVDADFTPLKTEAEIAAEIAAAEAARARNAELISNAGLLGSMGDCEMGLLPLADSNLEDVPGVSTESNVLIFRLLVDQIEKYQKTVEKSEPFRLPGGYRGREIEFELSGNVTVKQVNLATSVAGLSEAQP